MRPMLIVALLAPVLMTPAVSGAQERTARPVTARAAEFAEPFSSMTSLVELAGGGVLVYDSQEKKLGVADFAGGTFREVARQGAGPLEYRTAISLLRVPGDSVMVWDLANSRRLMLAPDGSPVRTTPVGDPGQPMMRFGQPIPRAADASGRWYASFQGMALVGRELKGGESTAVVRIAPATNKRDTLAAFAIPPREPTRSSTGVTRIRAPGFPARSAWGVFPDGRVLIVHGEEYRPEVIRPDGTRTMAAPIPFARVAITAKERADHLKSVEGRMTQMMGMARAASGSGEASRVEVLEPEPWQPHKPAILDDEIRVDSRSRAWVRVIDRDEAAGERYDLLDADGKLVDAIRMPRGVKLVAMGKGVLYGTREDADGLIYLQRFPLP